MTREEAVGVIKDFVAYGEHVNAFVYKGSISIPIEALNMAIEALEQEPKREKWIAIDDTHSQCMECGAIFCITSSDEWEVKYCPNCGTRMESDEE